MFTCDTCFIFTPVDSIKHKPTWRRVLPFCCNTMSCFGHVTEVIINKHIILTRTGCGGFFFKYIFDIRSHDCTGQVPTTGDTFVATFW